MLLDTYKILTNKQWEKAQETGYIRLPMDEKDGFIHLSTAPQLAATLSFFFEDHEKLILLELKQHLFKESLVFEAPFPKDSRSTPFPHLYSELKVSQIFKVWEIERGAFILPKEILLKAEGV
jgi:uncharacterized protein (DUF952 family)